MKKHLIFSLLVFLLLISCQQNVLNPEYTDFGFIAETETFGTQTKTSLNGQNSIEWSAEDRIAVFQGSTIADVFEVTSAYVGNTTGSFKEVPSTGDDGFVSGTEISDNVAVYPYNADLGCSNGKLSGDEVIAYRVDDVYYPSVQHYQAKSFPDNSFVMVAVTDGTKDHKLKFRNLSGALRLRIKGTTSIKSISVTGNSEEPLSGNAVVLAYKDGSAPVIERFKAGFSAVTLDCGDGVPLNEYSSTEFMIALPPTVFKKGFTVRVVDVDGIVDERVTEKLNVVNRSRILNMPEITFGEDPESDYSDAVDLNADGTTANSYIVSEVNTYRFDPVKGNSSESVGTVADVEVLWETFNTSEAPYEGELVAEIGIDDDGDILFSTADVFREGNALIAAKDANGKILWSWHLWFTDQPAEHIYKNGAGTMMDRNLGATSATPGDPGALGLLYQWGRKDPFLGASSVDKSVEAKSTGVWPDYVDTNPSVGTIAYSVSHPMTFIEGDDDYDDWLYNGYYSDPKERWAEDKTIYDPCPSGWKVPEGGFTGVWIRAGFDAWAFDDQNRGMVFCIEDPALAWYPTSGYKRKDQLYDVGNDGSYWAYDDYLYASHSLFFYGADGLSPYSAFTRSYAQSVRCFKEDSEMPLIGEHEAVSLHPDGETANSYIVTRSGNYKFKAVAGNSNGALRDAVMVDVLWESFGTEVYPERHDLIKFAYYTDGMVIFSTADTFREGNAVIAARDIDGEILWSWHIWFTDQPSEHVYANGAGTMMDRNLGATSAIPGDVGALGLMYQWGRKDPFLGSSSISSNVVAKSTLSWPTSVSSDSSYGTISYSVKNPTTFIDYNTQNLDWYHTGNSSTDNTRWTSEKGLYDPCPAGWRVPDGGNEGIWVQAGIPSFNTYDSSAEGMTFAAEYCGSAAWYPAAGFLGLQGGSLANVGANGENGLYWTVTPNERGAQCLVFDAYTSVLKNNSKARAYGHSVRCYKMGSSTYIPLSGVQVSQGYAELEVGEVLYLTATVIPSDATERSLEWSTSDSSVASVDQNGVVIAHKAGTTRITVMASVGGYADYCDVVVLSGFGSGDEKLEDDGDTDWN